MQATSAPSVNGREPDATDRETEPNIEATDAAGDGIEKVPPTGRTSVTKIKGPKKKTSPVWKHFTERKGGWHGCHEEDGRMQLL